MYSSWLRDVHNNVATPALGDALQLAPHLVPSLSAITLTMSVKQAVGNDEGRRGGK
jgi:hypothetical protein